MVSIRGYWVGPVSKVTGPSGPVECGSDLALDGLDFTRSPGVDGAPLTESAPSRGRIIRESVAETDEQLVDRLVEARLRVLRAASRPGALAELAPRELRQLAGAAFLRPVAESGGDSAAAELTEAELRWLDAESFRDYASVLMASRQRQTEEARPESPFNAPGELRSPFWRPRTGACCGASKSPRPAGSPYPRLGAKEASRSCRPFCRPRPSCAPQQRHLAAPRLAGAAARCRQASVASSRKAT